MKTHGIISASNGFNSLAIAIIVLIFAAIAAEAQSDRGAVVPLPNNITNGLFTPTQSQRFFQNGREAFEREVKIFNHPERYWDNNVLQFDRGLIEQMSQLKLDKQLTRNQEIKILLCINKNRTTFIFPNP